MSNKTITATIPDYSKVAAIGSVTVAATFAIAFPMLLLAVYFMFPPNENILRISETKQNSIQIINQTSEPAKNLVIIVTTAIKDASKMNGEQKITPQEHFGEYYKIVSYEEKSDKLQISYLIDFINGNSSLYIPIPNAVEKVEGVTVTNNKVALLKTNISADGSKYIWSAKPDLFYWLGGLISCLALFAIIIMYIRRALIARFLHLILEYGEDEFRNRRLGNLDDCTVDEFLELIYANIRKKYTIHFFLKHRYKKCRELLDDLKLILGCKFIYAENASEIGTAYLVAPFSIAANPTFKWLFNSKWILVIEYEKTNGQEILKSVAWQNFKYLIQSTDELILQMNDVSSSQT